MDNGHGYVNLFDQNIRAFFRDALRKSFKDPGLAFFLLQTLRQQTRATRVRQAWRKRGVHVPPFVIASITHQCNLHCKGCYAQAFHHASEAEMSADKLRSVLAEARELGISIILLAGGEPLTRPEILDITTDFPEIVFPLFTNGLLMDEEITERLKRQRNVVPVISIEGHQIETDGRRGQGVYQHLLKRMEVLREQNVFFGTSLTLTRQNFATVMDERFVNELIDVGCQLFFFIEYVPVQEDTERLILTEEQREGELRALDAFRAKLPALFVAFPGDEEIYGGCLAAGRGLVHISPEGNVEPCPFSPYSDASLKDLSLKQALQSKLLQTIRESDEHLSEVEGGCALWEKREWVGSLLRPGGGGLLV